MQPARSGRQPARNTRRLKRNILYSHLDTSAGVLNPLPYRELMLLENFGRNGSNSAFTVVCASSGAFIVSHNSSACSRMLKLKNEQQACSLRTNSSTRCLACEAYRRVRLRPARSYPRKASRVSSSIRARRSSKSMPLSAQAIGWVSVIRLSPLPPTVHRNQCPNCFHQSERPGSLKESVNRAQGAGTGKS